MPVGEGKSGHECAGGFRGDLKRIDMEHMIFIACTAVENEVTDNMYPLMFGCTD